MREILAKSPPPGGSKVPIVKKLLTLLPGNGYNEFQSETGREGSLDKKTILIVDDEDATRALMDFILTKEGYNVIQADNGKKALEILRNAVPDLFILDIVMPDMNGYDLFQTIKKEDRFKTTPLVFSSGKEGMKDFLDMEEGAKPDAFLIKPFKIQDLVEVVNRLLKKA